jgi:hypothetical protein
MRWNRAIRGRPPVVANIEPRSSRLMEPPPPTTGASPSDVPNAARIYNYTIGGSHYFPVDQAAAEYMFLLEPSTPK